MTEKEQIEKFYTDIETMASALREMIGEMVSDETTFDHEPFLPYMMISAANMDLCLQTFKAKGLLTEDEMERLIDEINGESDDE